SERVRPRRPSRHTHRLSRTMNKHSPHAAFATPRMPHLPIRPPGRYHQYRKVSGVVGVGGGVSCVERGRCRSADRDGSRTRDAMQADYILELPNDVRAIERTVEFLTARCREAGFSGGRLRLNFRVGVTEALANAMRYGNRY